MRREGARPSRADRPGTLPDVACRGGQHQSGGHRNGRAQPAGRIGRSDGILALTLGIATPENALGAPLAGGEGCGPRAQEQPAEAARSKA